MLSPRNHQKSKYIEMLQSFRRRRGEVTMLFPAMDLCPPLFPQLASSTKVLSIGSGLAQYDVEFIHRCMPNIRNVLMVEADPTCYDFLTQNLSTMLTKRTKGEQNKEPGDDNKIQNAKNKEAKKVAGSQVNGSLNGKETHHADHQSNRQPDAVGNHVNGFVNGQSTNHECNGNRSHDKNGSLENNHTGVENHFYSTLNEDGVRIEIVNALAQEWNASLKPEDYEKADVALVMQVLYYFSKEERFQFFENCFTRWLKPGGIAFIVHMTDVNKTNLLQNIYRELQAPLQLEIAEIKSEILSTDLEIVLEHPYACDMDLSNLEEECIDYLISFSSKQGSKERILKAIEKVSNEGKGTYMAELIAVRRKAPTQK